MSSIGEALGGRVRELRRERGYSLDVLAERSGVSRSAISLIERAATSPTAVVLEKLATGLGVTLASLFDPPGGDDGAHPVARRADQPTWRDPQSGYLRRNVSPPRWPSPIRIVEVEFPPGASVAYETAERDVEVHQQLWILDGEMDVTVGPTTHHLATGDCLAHRLDQPTAFHNPTPHTTRYAAILVPERHPTRRPS